jgi:hypothetical protein
MNQIVHADFNISLKSHLANKGLNWRVSGLLLAGSVLLASCFLVNPLVWAEDLLAPLETQYFSATFEQESQEARIARLESFVYGEPQTGDLAKRQEQLLKLKATLSPETTSSQSNSEETQDASTPTLVQPPARPDATDYPTVTAMEKKVFGQDYRQEAIGERLSRLEKEVFGKPSSNMELVDRVDRLQAKVPASAILYDPQEALYNPARPSSSGQARQPNPSNYQGHIPQNQPSPYQIGFGDVYLKLDELERGFLNGESHTGRLITERLTFLEQRVYGATFATDSLDTRLNRLNSAYQRRFGPYGQNSAPGQNNSGYTPRPMIQSRPGQPRPGYGGPAYTDYYNYYVPPGTVAPRPQPYGDRGDAVPEERPSSREVQITRQSQWDSPFGAGRSRSQTSFMTSAPGTVVFQETTEYPGLLNYQGPVVLNGPGGAASAGWVGVENETQFLNQLEMIATGIMQPAMPFDTRLIQLEQRLIGRPQLGLSNAQRLNQLSQLLRYQQMHGAGVGGIYPAAPTVIPIP